MNATSSSADHFITPDQLCVGLHIHLDLAWSEHPFTFSSFRIKSKEQIAIIQGLGLQQIRYSPAKSTVAPLPVAAPATLSEPAAVPTTGADSAGSMQQERLRRLAEQKLKASACQRAFQSAARTIRAINQNVLKQPEEAKAQATALISSIADSMLVDADVSLQLMADKASDEVVYVHSLNVSLMSMMLAKELKAPPEVVQLVGMGALFHDVGELEIPDRIVRKLEAHTKAELALLHMHCEYGVDLALKMNLPIEVVQVILQHHERVNGSGYPQGLGAAQMPLPARIVSLVNAYDELCNPADPARALTPHEALSLMYAQQRAQFDPVALSTFVRCMGVYPPGTVVGLSGGATAMVVSVNTAKPLRPVVLLFDPAVPKEDALLLDLETEPSESITKTFRPQQLPAEVRAYLSVQKRMSYYFDTDAAPASN